MYTYDEIMRQCEWWIELPKLVRGHRAGLDAFLERHAGADGVVCFIGAGSSEYVGRAILPYLKKYCPYAVDCCGTTDLVVAPESCVDPDRKTVLVSFARSGDSPESLGAIKAAQAVSDNISNVIITCNYDGALSKYGKGRGDCYVINLPQIINDSGFAMTNSFTSMYYTALLCFAGDKTAECAAAISQCAEHTDRLLRSAVEMLAQHVCELEFERVVYLGSEALKGIAQESALKMLELTRGGVASLYDTPMGFRHGPKSFINDRTLTVLYLSDREYSRRYELDLLREMASQRGDDRILTVCATPCAEAEELSDYYLCFDNETKCENALVGPELLTAAQMIALRRSESLGIDPDDPNPAGVVNRVVKGVTIYEYERG